MIFSLEFAELNVLEKMEQHIRVQDEALICVQEQEFETVIHPSLLICFFSPPATASLLEVVQENRAERHRNIWALTDIRAPDNPSGPQGGNHLGSRPPDNALAYLLPVPPRRRLAVPSRGIPHGRGGRRVAEAVAGAHRKALVRRLSCQAAAAEAAGEARAGGGGSRREELVGAPAAPAAPSAAAAQDRGRRKPALRHLHPDREC
jgi:hypothetical protein